jgi:hypothetical protein
MILFEFFFNLKRVYKVKLFILAFKSHSMNYERFQTIFFYFHKIIQKEFKLCFDFFLEF